MSGWKVRSAAAVMAALAVLTAMGGAQAGAAAKADKPKVGGALRVGINNEPAVLDPVRYTQGSAGGGPDLLGFAVFGQLVIDDIASKSIKPFMAESIKTADAGKTWTLKLRSGMKFSDGTDFNAAAVKFSWDRAADASTGSQYVAFSKTLTYQVVDPTTLTITLAAQDTMFDRLLAGQAAYNQIVSPTAVGTLKAGFGNTPVGAGPFVVKEWVKQNHITFARNPNYFDKPRPYLDTLTTYYLPVEDVRWNTLEAGQADVMWTQRTPDIDAAKANPDLQQLILPQIGYRGLGFSQTIPPLNDPDVRKALYLATNIEQASQATWPGFPAAHEMIIKGSPYYGGQFPNTDLVAAQKLIDGYLQKTGAKSVVPVITCPATTAYNNLCQVLKAQWERLKGVSVSIPVMTVTLSAGTNPMIQAGANISGTTTVFPGIFNKWATTGAQNTVQYSNPDFDAAMAKAMASTDPKTQTAQLKKGVEILTQGLVTFPIGHFSVSWISYKNKVGGVTGWSDGALRPDLIFAKTS